MSEVVITRAAVGLRRESADCYATVPCFDARQGTDLVLKAWVELSGYAAKIAEMQLEQDGIADAQAQLNRALFRYGVQRMEAIVRDSLMNPVLGDNGGGVWKLTPDDVPELLKIATEKECTYQVRSRRDLFCLTPAPTDETATYAIEGKMAAPTSRPICKACDLPNTDYLCSHFLHPQVYGTQTMGSYSRKVRTAICDLGKDEITDPQGCRPGGHSCWQRIVEEDVPTQREPVSPLDLPEALDVFDAHWRLAFGKKHRLLSYATAVAPAELALACTSRETFKSRLSALADTIDRLEIQDNLLPDNATKEQTEGSLNRLETCLTHQLPAEYNLTLANAIRVLRQARRLRNTMQHTGGEGNATSSLAVFNITDAPPNWTGAWDAIRGLTADAVNVIRRELRRWIDEQAS